jgi:hypothetical protein
MYIVYPTFETISCKVLLYKVNVKNQERRIEHCASGSDKRIEFDSVTCFIRIKAMWCGVVCCIGQTYYRIPEFSILDDRLRVEAVCSLCHVGPTGRHLLHIRCADSRALPRCISRFSDLDENVNI